MIQELVALSGKLPKGTLAHDALDNVPISVDCVIDPKGNFKGFIVHDKQLTLAERIAAKKGKARLLVDKAEEVLAFGKNSKKKHKLFREKLDAYRNLKELSSVISFYESNRANGVEKARSAFAKEVEEKQRQGNIAFLLLGETTRFHEGKAIYNAIVERYEASLADLKDKRFGRCSICGSSSSPVVDLPHGMIKRVPDGQTSGCALVSYNFNAAESYGLKGNENASICMRCARAYVDALNWLLSNGSPSHNEKAKEIFLYKNRKNISDDTAVVFWLRDKLETAELDLLDRPDEGKIRALMDSVFAGRPIAVKHIDTDMFYAITLSGAAARIAVRDWIETSLDNLRNNLARWFQDIELARYNPDEKKLTMYYPRYSTLVWNVKSKGANDVQHGRIGAVLWKCAVMGHSLPLWLLSAVLNRIRAEQSAKPDEGKKRSPWEYKLPDRIGLLKLFMNRTSHNKGGIKYMATLDKTNPNTAYICGEIFAVLESIQYYAMGSDINAGIRERFFSFASTMPSTAFGRLMKLTQHHLSKIRGENTGLAINLDKKLGELMSRVEGSHFPAVFSLEDQASFAIGYYHQRQKDFHIKSDNKEN
jgi:CRISPR-associated protein Csd1